MMNFGGLKKFIIKLMLEINLNMKFFIENKLYIIWMVYCVDIVNDVVFVVLVML